jgi:hypothetical protein
MDRAKHRQALQKQARRVRAAWRRDPLIYPEHAFRCGQFAHFSACPWPLKCPQFLVHILLLERLWPINALCCTNPYRKVHCSLSARLPTSKMGCFNKSTEPGIDSALSTQRNGLGESPRSGPTPIIPNKIYRYREELRIHTNNIRPPKAST